MADCCPPENSALPAPWNASPRFRLLCARAKEFDLAFGGAAGQRARRAPRRAGNRNRLRAARQLSCRNCCGRARWPSPPRTTTRTISVLKTFWQYHGQDANFFIVETRRQLLHIRHEEILYFESRGKSVYPHTLSGAAESFPARLDVVAARLAPYRYVRCHQSYLANLRHVRQLNKVTHQLTLSSGATIPISKQYYAQVIECLRADRA